MRLTFELTLLSDYHIGAGHGLGSVVDSALLRDGDGVPVLRGSTVEGLLRDGLWRLLQLPPLAAYYRQHQAEEARYNGIERVAAYCQAPLQCPLCRVFGTPASPKRWRIASARPSGADKNLYAENPAKSKWKAGQTSAQVAARVRISPRTRRAEAHKLFSQEEGDARLTFRFTLDGPDDERTLDEAALLVAAARMIRRLGAARQRGRGECRLHLLQAETQDELELPEGLDIEAGLLEHFRAWLNGTETPLSSKPKPRQWRSEPGDKATPLRRWIILRTDEPVLLANRTQAGNTFETVDYIRGGALLGALADLAASRWNLAGDNPQESVYRVFVDLFKRGAVRFPILYPARNVSNRSLIPTVPAPLDLLTCKVYPGLDTTSEQHGAHGYAREQNDPEKCQRCADEGHENVPLVALGGYASLEVTPNLASLRRRQELHPRIDPCTQRVVTGNLFGYVALESGQWFMGEIWCRDEQTWNNLRQLTSLADRQPLALRLGKATRRGYGLVTLWLEELPSSNSIGADAATDIWRGKPLEGRVILADDASMLELTLTLLTDTIVVDSWGQFYQTFSKNLLAQLLCKPLSIINAYCKSGYVDTFNNQLGLPHWRDIAMKAGSAVGIRLTPPTTESERSGWWDRLLQRLRDLEESGIGLRRQEGFGQVVFNHPVYESGAGEHIEVSIPNTLCFLDKSNENSAANLVQTERSELRDWKRQLPDRVKKMLNTGNILDSEKTRQRWRAMARWLYNAADRPLQELEEDLQSFGKSTWLTAVEREGKGDVSDREKDAREKLLQLLREADKSPTVRLRQRCVETLADRLAALTREIK